MTRDADDVPEARAELVEAPAQPLALGGRIPAASPAEVYVLTLNTPKSRQTAVEALHRLMDILEPALAPGSSFSWRTFPWQGMTPEAAIYARRCLVDNGAPNTARLTLSIMRGVLREAWRLGLLDAETYQRCATLPRITGESAPAGRMLSEAEVTQLVAYLDALSGDYGIMAAAVFAVALGGGLRREELTRPLVSSIVEDGRALRFLGKGRQERVQHLPPWTTARVAAWVAARARKAWKTPTLFLHAYRGELFDRAPTVYTIWDLVTSVGAAAGLDHFSPHDLRRTFASRLIDAGDLGAAQKAMAHKNPSTTLRYDRRGQGVANRAIDALAGWGFEKTTAPVEGKEREVPTHDEKPNLPGSKKPLTATLGELARLSKEDDAMPAVPAVKVPREDPAPFVPANDGDSTPSPSLVHPLTKQKLVDMRAARAFRRIVKQPDFTRDGKACDVSWIRAQVLRLKERGRSERAIAAALAGIGVCGAGGEKINVEDVKRLADRSEAE